MPAQSSARNTVTVINPGTQTSVAGTAVSLQIEARDSASGQTLTYTAVNLPPGLSINSSTGLISGTIPSVAQSFAVTVTAKDTTGASGSAAFTWTLNKKVTVTSGIVGAAVGTPVSLQPEAGDWDSGQTLTYTAAGLPPGMSIDSSTGLISGTPSAAGTFPSTVTAKDPTGGSGSGTITWLVDDLVTVTNPGTQDSATGTAVRLAIKASAGARILTYTAAGLPPGVSVNSSTGLISGTTPSTAGNFTVTVTVTDSTGSSGSAVFGWAVRNLVTVTSPGTQISVIGTAVSLQVKASESPSGRTLTYTVANLPPGVSIDSSTGLVSGVPSAPGDFGVTVTAHDPTGSSGSAAFTWIILSRVTVTNPGTQISAIGTAVSLEVKASDTLVPDVPNYTAAGLPPGLSISPSTGLISGTPSMTGDFAVTVTAQNNTNVSAPGSATFTWIVHNLVTVTNPGTQTSTTGTPVSVPIHAIDSASGQTLTYTAVNLPPGLSINRSTGLISGTIPTSTPVFSPATAEVTAEDTTGASGSAAFGWIIRNLVTVTNPGTQTSATGTPVSVPIHASDSDAGETLTYTAAGLPPGLSVNPSTGLISGTPSAPGGFSVTATAQDQSGSSGSAHFAWIIRNLVTVTNPGTQTSVLGAPVNVPVHASDSDAGQTLSYTAAGLPPGLSIDPSTGLISGTIPTSTPLFPPATVTVTAQDTTGTSGSTGFTWQLTELAE